MKGKLNDEFAVFGRNIKILGHEHNMTRRELAGRLGIPEKVLKKLEHGKIAPSLTVDVVRQVAEIFQVKDYLLLIPKKERTPK